MTWPSEEQEEIVADTLKIRDVVALLEDIPDHRLHRGQVGTIIEKLAPQVFEIEFSDDHGRTYALLVVHADQLIALHYAPAMAI